MIDDDVILAFNLFKYPNLLIIETYLFKINNEELDKINFFYIIILGVLHPIPLRNWYYIIHAYNFISFHDKVHNACEISNIIIQTMTSFDYS